MCPTKLPRCYGGQLLCGEAHHQQAPHRCAVGQVWLKWRSCCHHCKPQRRALAPSAAVLLDLAAPPTLRPLSRLRLSILCSPLSCKFRYVRPSKGTPCGRWVHAGVKAGGRDARMTRSHTSAHSPRHMLLKPWSWPAVAASCHCQLSGSMRALASCSTPTRLHHQHLRCAKNSNKYEAAQHRVACCRCQQITPL